MGAPTVTTLEGREGATASPARQGPRGGPGRGLRPVRWRRGPRLWFEVLLVAVSYWTYSLVRNAVPEQRAQALRNAGRLWHLEEHLGIAVETGVNHAVNSVTWLIVGMNYYYATLHFAVTLGVLVWLYRRHPGRYGAARTALFATTALALAGYWLFPLAPPRLMPSGGFVDTVLVHGTWGSMASGDLKDVSNQYAAMPSIHIGWSLWSGLVVFALASVPWARALALLYPVATLLVIVATGNHFWLDAVGGLVCLAVGLAVARACCGTRPWALRRAGAVSRTGGPGPRPGPREGAAGEAPAAVADPRAGPGPGGRPPVGTPVPVAGPRGGLSLRRRPVR